MTFDFNKRGIKEYLNTLGRRLNTAKKIIATDLITNLYNNSPKKTGALAANYNISVNAPSNDWDPNKTIFNLNLPPITIKDDYIINNSCPYILFVNNGTTKIIPQHFIEISISQTKSKLKTLLSNISKIN